MVEELRCPQCGSAARKIEQGGSALCTGCGAIFRLAPEKPAVPVSCPQCGRENDQDARTCANCGAPLAKHCPRCGARLGIRMRFCDRCGGNHAELSTPHGRCHWCGLQNSADSELCEGCGARLIAVCPVCGARMKAGLNYCAACGLDFEQLIQDQAE
jgi:predicted amidophosphoribosyltransferase